MDQKNIKVRFYYERRATLSGSEYSIVAVKSGDVGNVLNEFMIGKVYREIIYVYPFFTLQRLLADLWKIADAQTGPEELAGFRVSIDGLSMKLPVKLANGLRLSKDGTYR